MVQAMNKKIPLILIFAAILIGLTIGFGSYTFIYAKGYAYFSDDPKACMNCHLMRDQYESWNRSSHHAVATCNSCHTPKNFVMKYVNKADNGFWHSLKFTTGNYKDPLQIRAHNFNITMKACMNCHFNLMNTTIHQQGITEGRSCVSCHRSVGHAH